MSLKFISGKLILLSSLLNPPEIFRDIFWVRTLSYDTSQVYVSDLKPHLSRNSYRTGPNLIAIELLLKKLFSDA